MPEGESFDEVGSFDAPERLPQLRTGKGFSRMGRSADSTLNFIGTRSWLADGPCATNMSCYQMNKSNVMSGYTVVGFIVRNSHQVTSSRIGPKK